jgi:hypothetical protein
MIANDVTMLAARGDLRSLAKALRDDPSAIHARADGGACGTPLHAAVSCNAVLSVMALLAAATRAGAKRENAFFGGKKKKKKFEKKKKKKKKKNSRARMHDQTSLQTTSLPPSLCLDFLGIA